MQILWQSPEDIGAVDSSTLLNICSGYTLQIRHRSLAQTFNGFSASIPAAHEQQEYFINAKKSFTDVGDAGLQNPLHEHTTSAISFWF